MAVNGGECDCEDDENVESNDDEIMIMYYNDEDEKNYVLVYFCVNYEFSKFVFLWSGRGRRRSLLVEEEAEKIRRRSWRRVGSTSRHPTRKICILSIASLGYGIGGLLWILGAYCLYWPLAPTRVEPSVKSPILMMTWIVDSFGMWWKSNEIIFLHWIIIL